MSLRIRVSVWSICCLICLIASPCAHAQSEISAGTVQPKKWTGVRVVDSQQWVYEDVTLSWVQGGAFLQLRRTDGAARLFRPENISRVYDGDGREITRDVAAARNVGSPPPQTNPLGGFSEVNAVSPTMAVLVGPNLFHSAVDFGLGYGITAGEWYWRLGNGVNYHLGWRIGLKENRYLRLAFRAQSLGHASAYEGMPEGSTSNFSVDLREYRILFGRHMQVKQQATVRTVTYGEFGLDIMEHRFSAKPVTDSITKFGLVAQAGIWFLVNESAAVDLSSCLVWKPGFSSDEPNGTVIEVHAALVLYQ